MIPHEHACEFTQPGAENDNSYLGHDNDGEEGGEGVEHAGALLRGAAATEESEDEEDDSADDEQESTVGVALIEKLEEFLH